VTAARTFARWALGLTVGDVPASALAAAKKHLLDGLGCALAAARAGEARAPVAVAHALGGAPESTILGARARAAGADAPARVSAPAAALANGALVHALDYDDTHGDALVHATAAVLPAAFAVGEQTNASGAQILAAAIAGYETVIRIGAAVRHGFHAKGLHATSVCGVFSSALVAPKLLGLDETQTTNALGIAGSVASGSLEFLRTGSSTKQLHPGLSGMNGILAARLAAAGADGPDSIFEGEYGLYASLLGARVDPAALTEGLGARWEVERIAIKPTPACQLSHASLDALRTLLPKLVDPSQIERVAFVVPDAAVPIVCEPASEKRQPRTPYEGKFSLAYCAAALIADGTLGIESFTPAMLAREDVRALAARVEHTSKSFGVAPADAPGEVEVTLKNGERLHATVEKSRGAQLSEDDVRAKFLANGGTEATARAVLSLETQPDLSAVVRA
jgi:2-methylcitrate dehydratase PrpD